VDAVVGFWGSAHWRESVSATKDVSAATWGPAVAPPRRSPASSMPTADWPASSPALRESPARDCCVKGPEFRARSAIEGTAHRPWSSAVASEPSLLQNNAHNASTVPHAATVTDWLSCGFTSHSTQNRSFRRSFPEIISSLVMEEKTNLAQ